MQQADSVANPIDKTSVYAAGGLIAGAGALMLNALPVLFGALAETFHLDDAQLGNLAFSANISFAILGVISLAWVKRVSWRTISVTASVVVAVSFLFILAKPSYGQLLGVMAIAGGGTGALYALAMVLFGDSSQPARAFGFKLGIETLAGAVVLLLLPIAVAPIWGFDGIMIAFAAAVIVMGILTTPWIPSRGAKSDSNNSMPQGVTSRQAHASVWMVLIAGLIFMTGVIAVWAFLELIGKDHGIASGETGIVLSVGLLINAGGGFIAGVLGTKLGRVLPVVLVTAGSLIGLFLIGDSRTLTGFATGTMLFQFSAGFVLAYVFGLTSEFDISGKLVALGSLCISLGGALGPAIAGHLVEWSGFSAALIFAAVCEVVSVVAYAALTRRVKTILPEAGALGTHPPTGAASAGQP